MNFCEANLEQVENRLNVKFGIEASYKNVFCLDQLKKINEKNPALARRSILCAE